MTLKDIKYSAKRQIKEVLRWTIYVGTFSFLKENNVKKVCVFHIGRCGSTILADLINQHRKVFWDGKKISRWMVDHPTKTMSNTEFERYIKTRTKGRIKPWYCLEIEEENFCKLDFSMDVLFNSLKKLGFNKVIVLERKNYLHSIISRVSAIESGIWHLKKSRTKEVASFNLDLSRPLPHFPDLNLIQLLENYTRFYKEVKEESHKHNINLLNIDFDNDINSDPILAYDKICDAFELDKAEVEVKFVKTIDKDPDQLVLNLTELKQRLSGTEFESMLK